MSAVASSSDILRGILRHPRGGIVGLVDDLLAACRDHGLRLDWQLGRFRVRSFVEDWQELGGLTLRKTVFRSILARLAALCNERHPDSCSPYGGQGEIAVGTTVFHVVFTNTPGEQRLELTQDRPALQPTGGNIMTIPPASEPAGHPALVALLANVPRLRNPLLWGWTEGRLLPALDAFHDNATEAEVADAWVNLRKVLRGRADVEQWLDPIAEQCSEEYAGDPRAMTADSKLKRSIDLPGNRTKNQFTVDQVRQLREALRPPLKKEKPPSPPAPPRPDVS